MSFDKNRRISGRLTIIVIAALMLAFVIVPAMGAPLKCSAYCSGWKKVALPGGAPMKTSGIAYTFIHKDPITGIKTNYGLWVEQTRYCSGSQYVKTCTPRTWCPNTRKCEKTGVPTVQTRPASGIKCTPWEVTAFEMRKL